MKKDSIYLMYLQRVIHANGNAFKSKAGKWKLNSAGDVGMILLNRQEDQDRLRKERLPIKNPHKLQLIQPIKRGILSIWKLINENIIATIVGGYLLYQLIKHL